MGKVETYRPLDVVMLASQAGGRAPRPDWAVVFMTALDGMVVTTAVPFLRMSSAAAVAAVFARNAPCPSHLIFVDGLRGVLWVPGIGRLRARIGDSSSRLRGRRRSTSLTAPRTGNLLRRLIPGAVADRHARGSCPRDIP
jgi:hypothetical protein